MILHFKKTNHEIGLTRPWVREMSQLLKCPPYKHKDLSSIPTALLKKGKGGGRGLSSQTWGGPLVLLGSLASQRTYLTSSRAVRDCLSKNKTITARSPCPLLLQTHGRGGGRRGRDLTIRNQFNLGVK